jgi:CheY-like chemotaxis protein
MIDIGLPDISGHEVARRIREEVWGRGVLLIALTAGDKRAISCGRVPRASTGTVRSPWILSNSNGYSLSS